jgi:hypothetical protein
MLKRLFAALLLGGLLLGLTPTTAFAYDDHYRCMYHCAERGYGGDGYGSDRYGSNRYRSDRSRYDRYGYGQSNRVYHNGECWYHDDWGWRRCGYRRYGSSYGGGYSRDYGSYDRYYGSPNNSASSDSHRHHPRNP